MSDIADKAELEVIFAEMGPDLTEARQQAVHDETVRLFVTNPLAVPDSTFGFKQCALSVSLMVLATLIKDGYIDLTEKGRLSGATVPAEPEPDEPVPSNVLHPAFGTNQ